ncbi:MAG: hypothetical protein RLZZ426_506 [Actinomycetota bacterium]
MADLTAGLSVLDLDDFRVRVSQTIESVLAEQTPLLLAVSPELLPLAETTGRLMKGGKRLRPAFAYWGWRAAGGDASDQAVAAATSLEFLQACALIHDDVMDGSSTRRGMPAVHKYFESLHSDSQWLGNSANFGSGAAILLGDLCLSWADELLLTSQLPVDALLRAKPIYDIMRTELMAGQYLDLLEQSRAGADVERILNVVRYKSAKYTIERPLHLGAALANASENVMLSLTDYGLPLGEAFQLRDDVLGVFGDPSVTGKPAGDDLREGKRTVLVALAYEQAPKSASDVLRSKLGQADLSSEDIEQLRDIITTSGSLAAVEHMIDIGREAALTALETADITEQSKFVLANLAVAATQREA